MLDLRRLNEPLAGETGHVRADARGAFVRGDGRPIRFWAVNTEVGRGTFVAKPLGPKAPADLQRHAQFLAKRGVNMVRLHRQISPNLKFTPDAKIDEINRAERDSIWRTVAAMRPQGIYTTLSVYWAAATRLAPGWGVGDGSGEAPWGLLFFDPTLQAAYKAWLRDLLLPPNPYTGLPLGRDPSLAILQIQNEDSLLFWTFDRIRGVQRERLEAHFGAFLAARHGSLAATSARWTGERIERTSLEAGRMPLLPMWQLTQPSTGGRAVRLADQTEFLARTMHDFNTMIVRYLRDDLGLKSLVNVGNWKTASTTLLNDAERWTYGPGEVDATNIFTTGRHQGRHAGWAIVDSDLFTNVSVLKEPARLPLALRQTIGAAGGPRPMVVTEGNWVMPNAFAAEGPFLVAGYSALLGIDGYCWFSTADEGWTAPASANGWLASQGKWILATPDILGTFPAAAWAYRMGYIDEAKPVLSERRSLRELWERRPPLLPERATFDPNRDAGDAGGPGAHAAGAAFDAFLVGPVQVEFDDTTGLTPTPAPAPPRPATAPVPQPALGAAPARAGGGTIRSLTGQIVLDPQRGFATIDAPRVQGVAAHFENAPRHALSSVTFESGNVYGAALVLSMDGAPLSRSGQVLVQYGTQSRPTGWREEPAALPGGHGAAVAGFEIKQVGGAPWQVTAARLRVTLRNPGLTEGIVLDANGMPVGKVTLTRSSQGVTFAFPANAMHVVLR